MSNMNNANDLITSGVTFDVDSDVSFGAPKVNARGGKKVKILNKAGRTLTLATPLILTWGVNENDWDDSGRKTYEMSLQFPSEGYASESMQNFFSNMQDFQNKLLDSAVKNSKDWFGKAKMTREVLEALMTPMLKYPKDKETGEPDMTRSPTLRVKLDYWDEKFSCELYDTNEPARVLFTPSRGDCREGHDGGPVDIVTKASHVACIIQCGGLWFANGKFGVTWSLIQARVRPPARIAGSCFITLDDDDKGQMQNIAAREAEEDAQAEVAAEMSGGANEDSVFVADSDEDEDEEEEEARPPTPPPAPKKKKVVRRKKKAAEEEA